MAKTMETDVQTGVNRDIQEGHILHASKISFGNSEIMTLHLSYDYTRA